MDKLNMDANVSYNASSDSISLQGTGSSSFTLDNSYWVQPWYEPIREYYSYPVYVNTPIYEDKHKKAFNIAKLLLKEKLLVSRKLKDFIGLVEKIVKEL
jgi:hypothetical protein